MLLWFFLFVFFLTAWVKSAAHVAFGLYPGTCRVLEDTLESWGRKLRLLKQSNQTKVTSGSAGTCALYQTKLLILSLMQWRLWGGAAHECLLSAGERKRQIKRICRRRCAEIFTSVPHLSPRAWPFQAEFTHINHLILSCTLKPLGRLPPHTLPFLPTTAINLSGTFPLKQPAI